MALPGAPGSLVTAGDSSPRFPPCPRGPSPPARPPETSTHRPRQGLRGREDASKDHTKWPNPEPLEGRTRTMLSCSQPGKLRLTGASAGQVDRRDQWRPQGAGSSWRLSRATPAFHPADTPPPTPLRLSVPSGAAHGCALGTISPASKSNTPPVPCSRPGQMVAALGAVCARARTRPRAPPGAGCRMAAADNVRVVRGEDA